MNFGSCNSVYACVCACVRVCACVHTRTCVYASVYVSVCVGVCMHGSNSYSHIWVKVEPTTLSVCYTDNWIRPGHQSLWCACNDYPCWTRAQPTSLPCIYYTLNPSTRTCFPVSPGPSLQVTPGLRWMDSFVGCLNFTLPSLPLISSNCIWDIWQGDDWWSPKRDASQNILRPCRCMAE